MNNIDNLSEKKAIIFSRTIPIRTKLYGLRTEIYYPLPNDSHYQNDSKFQYNENPNQIKQILVLNLFKESLGNNANIDNIIQDNFIDTEIPYAITDYKNQIPLNSLLKVYKGNSFIEVRVDNNPKVVTGKNNIPLFVKYTLVPYT